MRTPQDQTHHKAPLPIARKINLVGQTKPKFRRKIRGNNNHAYKRSKKTRIIFMDRTDHKLAIHWIPTNTPQKLHQIDILDENMVLKIKERGKPSSYCLRIRRSVVNYSCIIGGAPMRIMNPSVIVSPLRQCARIGI